MRVTPHGDKQKNDTKRAAPGGREGDGVRPLRQGTGALAVAAPAAAPAAPAPVGTRDSGGSRGRGGRRICQSTRPRTTVAAAAAAVGDPREMTTRLGEGEMGGAAPVSAPAVGTKTRRRARVHDHGHSCERGVRVYTVRQPARLLSLAVTAAAAPAAAVAATAAAAAAHRRASPPHGGGSLQGVQARLPSGEAEWAPGAQRAVAGRRGRADAGGLPSPPAAAARAAAAAATVAVDAGSRGRELGRGMGGGGGNGGGRATAAAPRPPFDPTRRGGSGARR